MFTGIITDIGEVLVGRPPRRPDGPDRHRLRPGDDRHRRLDRLRRGLPDGGRDRRPRRGTGSRSRSRPRPSRSTAIGRNAWAPGKRLNLERALKVGDELGGHIVSGHVDGVAEVLAVTDEGGSTRVRFRAPEALARFVAPKGSVALNGTSLTVNEVEGREFGVNLIPHTKVATTWGGVVAGDVVNIEIDTLARYVARLNDWAA